MAPLSSADALNSVRLPRAESLTAAVVDAVREMVRSGRLVPGELYSVYQLSDLLGVSRSPVREGLLRLAEAGTVTFERNRGFRVAVPQAHDIVEIFAVRLVIEPDAAARVAAARGDKAAALAARLTATIDAMHAAGAAGDEAGYWAQDRSLHGLVLTAAGNRYAARIVDDLRRATWLLGRPTTAGARSLADITREHEPIVAAIAAGDPAAARSAMHDHLVHTGRLLVAQALGTTAEAPEVDAIWTPHADS
jgi:DNA-binding GntR family transcriptional regulator